jgi:Domain of unknown function (DUF6916)
MTDPTDEIIYRHGTYVPLVGTTFDVERPDGAHVAVKLVDATELQAGGACFSLLFRGPSDAPLEQRTYRVEHAALGEFPLFLVPLGPNADGAQELEAVVNRLARAEA